MFKLSFALVALALSGAVSLATPAKRAPALEVSLSAPAEVHSIDDLKVTASVTNTGSEPVKVLKVGTVFDNELPTRSFTVTKDDTAADFTGINVMIDMSALDDSSYVVIPAGETVAVEHDVATLYNFEALGTGAFEFEPKTTFQVIEADGKHSAYMIESAKKAKVTVKSDVKKRDLKVIEKRAIVSCSVNNQNTFINASYTEGQFLAKLAYNYIGAFGAADSLYKSYFGTAPTNTVRNVFNSAGTENSASRTLNSNDPLGVCPKTTYIAYTITTTTNIYYCPRFYNQVATSRLCNDTTVASRNVRGGTTLHELTHATSRTTDVGYGCAFDMNLGQTDPNKAVTNADNYNCFATQVYKNTQCKP